MNNQQKYDNFMDSMRAKLENPAYTGNKSEAYQAGIRAAMSKIKSLYDPKRHAGIAITPGAIFTLKRGTVITVINVIAKGRYADKRPDGVLEWVHYDIDRVKLHFCYENDPCRTELRIMTYDEFADLIQKWSV